MCGGLWVVDRASAPSHCLSFSQHCLSEIEVLAIIFAAAIHDYEHTGTTNSFHIQTKGGVGMRQARAGGGGGTGGWMW